MPVYPGAPQILGHSLRRAKSALIDRAVEQAYQRLAQQQNELGAVESKLKEMRAAMDRHFRAFEAGTMPEDTCAPRLACLNEQANALQRRASELATQQDDEQPERTDAAELNALRSQLRATLDNGAPTQIKTILQALTDEIRVDGRDHIEPTFRVPAIRPPAGSMEPTDLKSNRSARVPGGRMSLDVAE